MQSNTTPQIAGHEYPVSLLWREYLLWQSRFKSQPVIVQQTLQAQAQHLASSLEGNPSQLGFTLPDQVFIQDPASGMEQIRVIPQECREQTVGSLFERMKHQDPGFLLRKRLAELEHSSQMEVALCAGLIRYSIAYQIIYQLLPAGHPVTYGCAAGEEIPAIPCDRNGNCYYLPRWVAFDDRGKLLALSTVEAESMIASLKNIIDMLQTAIHFAPYFVADEIYQQKRYGVLGQLVNQGRALAEYVTGEIIQTIQKRAAAGDLNRGLWVSLPYFDDQSLSLKIDNFHMIPTGRIHFNPAYIVEAVQNELAKVNQDTRLSPSTRKYLMHELAMIGGAFESPMISLS